MRLVDDQGYMTIEVDGRMERRPAEIVRYHSAFGPSHFYGVRPETREGETLVEFIGRPPIIVRTNP